MREVIVPDAVITVPHVVIGTGSFESARAGPTSVRQPTANIEATVRIL
jgi:hypothetical protein